MAVKLPDSSNNLLILKLKNGHVKYTIPQTKWISDVQARNNKHAEETQREDSHAVRNICLLVDVAVTDLSPIPRRFIL